MDFLRVATKSILTYSTSAQLLPVSNVNSIQRVISISTLPNLFKIPELHKRSNPGWRRGPRGSRTLAADVPEGRLIWRCPRPLHSKQVGPAPYIVSPATISLSRGHGSPAPQYISHSTALIPPRCLSLSALSHEDSVYVFVGVLFSLVDLKKEFPRESDCSSVLYGTL